MPALARAPSRRRRRHRRRPELGPQDTRLGLELRCAHRLERLRGVGETPLVDRERSLEEARAFRLIEGADCSASTKRATSARRHGHQYPGMIPVGLARDARGARRGVRRRRSDRCERAAKPPLRRSGDGLVVATPRARSTIARRGGGFIRRLSRTNELAEHERNNGSWYWPPVRLARLELRDRDRSDPRHPPREKRISARLPRTNRPTVPRSLPARRSAKPSRATASRLRELTEVEQDRAEIDVRATELGHVVLECQCLRRRKSSRTFRTSRRSSSPWPA